MSAHKYANATWKIRTNQDGTISEMDAHLAVLMDIREELTSLSRVFGCDNFLMLPHRVRDIGDMVKRLNKRLGKRIKLK